MISVVVPAYNEEEGSRDGSLALLRTLASSDPRLKILSFSRSFCHQAAVTAWLAHAQGQVVAVIDADLLGRRRPTRDAEQVWDVALPEWVDRVLAALPPPWRR